MEIIKAPIDSIFPYENNPRDNSRGIAPVMESIKEFGFNSPIVVDKNNVIIAGHTRWEAAKKLGLKTVPVVVADLSEEKAKKYRLADNKVSEFSIWDQELLESELIDIDDIDMSRFGFEALDKKLDEKVYECNEIDVGGFEDEKFKHECKCCGFKFN